MKNNYSLCCKIAGVSAVLALTFFCLFNFSPLARAASASSSIGEGVSRIQQPLGMASTDIRTIIANIIKAALGLIGLVMLVLILYGGFLWMTAGGNEEQVGKAKKILINAVIGLIIILSAYSIVLFVMKLLGVNTGGNGSESYAAPNTTHFSGSGALGGIIKDHYPERDQKDVPRNTKIVITFKKPIDPKSVIEDTNGDGIYGNCTSNSWYSCDRVKKNASGALTDTILNIKTTSGSASIADAVVVATTTEDISGKSGFYTLVIKPMTDLTDSKGGYLGSATEDVGYTVVVGNGIKLNDGSGNGPGIFTNGASGDNYYKWSFTCSTNLDLTPPYVTDVYPEKDGDAPRNSIIQINFSKAMDPTGIQGAFYSGASGSYYYLRGGEIYLHSGNSAKPSGNFTLTNGYKTLEFSSSDKCGVNACGNPIYCLPVCDGSGTCSTNSDGYKYDTYSMLLKAGQAMSSSSFEAIPFSGVMDLSGNALDSNNNGKVDVPTTTSAVFPISEDFDNYYWSFNILNKIDLATPYLQRIIPGMDATYVAADEKVAMDFSKKMSFDSMYNITIKEVPADDNAKEQGIPLCKWFSMVNTTSPKSIGAMHTYTRLKHCDFLTGARYYYLPEITSDVEDVNYNCFYPGKGPDKASTVKDPSQAPYSLYAGICSGGTNCCNVNTSTAGEDYCCNGSVDGKLTSSTASCIAHLKEGK